MYSRRPFVIVALALACGTAAFGFHHAPAAASGAARRSCGAVTFARTGTVYRVLFAKNGAVQQYVLLKRTTTEQDHDVLVVLQNRYGPEVVNAPALRVTGFRQGNGGMMIPEKAVDSCGRIVSLK
jgi:hypothetical protein